MIPVINAILLIFLSFVTLNLLHGFAVVSHNTRCDDLLPKDDGEADDPLARDDLLAKDDALSATTPMFSFVAVQHSSARHSFEEHSSQTIAPKAGAPLLF